MTKCQQNFIVTFHWKTKQPTHLPTWIQAILQFPDASPRERVLQHWFFLKVPERWRVKSLKQLKAHLRVFVVVTPSKLQTQQQQELVAAGLLTATVWGGRAFTQIPSFPGDSGRWLVWLNYDTKNKEQLPEPSLWDILSLRQFSALSSFPAGGKPG